MIRLEEMNSEEYTRYLNYSVKNYAEEHIKAGNWTESEALNKATAEYKRLLPNGEKTEKNHLYMIRDGEQDVGVIWLALHSINEGFIYDLYIYEANQGRGYGKQAMVELERISKNKGLKSIGLHVFGHNNRARGLYKKLGYIETDIMMRKEF